MIQHHTSLDNISEVCEMQYLVVETEAMPKEDWIKTRVFCWMTSLLYFNKLLQIPFAILTKVSSCNYKTLIELFMNISPEYKQISEILNIFVKKAKYTPTRRFFKITPTSVGEPVVKGRLLKQKYLLD